MQAKAAPFLQIGEVAERTGVTQRTLRFYEEKGLLKPPTRMEGGFRLYSEDDVQRVEQIRRLQGLLGFSLADIKGMVEAEEELAQLRAEALESALDLADHRLRIERAIEVTERQRDVLDQKIGQLLEMQRSIGEKLAKLRARLQEHDKAATPAASGRSS